MNTQRMKVELAGYFDRYARTFNEALEGERAPESVAELHTEYYLGAYPKGVMGGATTGEEYASMLAQGFEQYRAIGTKRMEVRGVEVTPIDEFHAMARVQWRASYIRNRDQQPVDIDFAVTYFVQNVTPEDPGGWRVFASVTGDEQGAYEEHGLV